MLSTAIEEMGGDYHYKPSRFLQQFNWIEETFYSTTGSGKANRFYQRMITEAAVDTNALAIKATLIERYGKNLDAVIRKHCVSLIPPTSGTRFLPNDFLTPFLVGRSHTLHDGWNTRVALLALLGFAAVATA